MNLEQPGTREVLICNFTVCCVERMASVHLPQGNRMLKGPVTSAGRMGSRGLVWNACPDRPRAPGVPAHRGRRSPSAPGTAPFPGASLLIAPLAVICGADHGTAVEFFGHQKQAWLATFPGCRTACPHTTPSGASSVCWLRPRWKPALRRGCSRWPRPCRTRSWPWTARRPGVHTTRPGTCRPGIWSALGRTRPGWCWISGGDDRSNAITAIPARLETLALEGCIVTIDAMGGQKRIAQTIRDRGAD